MRMVVGKKTKMFSCMLSVLALAAFVSFPGSNVFAKGGGRGGSRGGRGGRHTVSSHTRHTGHSGKATHVKSHTAKNPKPHDVKAHTRHTQSGKKVHVKAHHKPMGGVCTPPEAVADVSDSATASSVEA